MKKIIVLVLAVVMCFSIVGCSSGPTYVTDEDFMADIELIELTTDNCMEYFELNEYEDVDDFGQPTGDKYLGIKLKDGYAPISFDAETSVNNELLIKVSYVSVETEYVLDETTGELVENTYRSGWTNESEDDYHIYSSEDIVHITRTYSITDDKKTAWSYEVSNVEIKQIKGVIFKSNIQEDKWQTTEEGEQFFLVGLEDNYSKVENDEYLELDLQDAIKESLERQANNVE